MSRIYKRYKVGSRAGEHVTIVSVIVEPRGRHPVYLGWDHRLWTPVVCKTYRSQRRAQKEHDALAELRHPNIVRSLAVYEPSIAVFEYLPGPTLDRFARSRPSGRMSVPDALRAMVHIGSALEHVHQRGWLHLDVKPGNVIVCHDRPVLFDFGTARRIGDPRPPKPQGTTAFMAPEECTLGTVTPASDVFSLGATLFELLTGEIPFPGKRYPQTSRAPLSARTLRSDIPAKLDKLIAACLEKDPGLRPPIPELLPALNALIARGPKMWPDSVETGRNAKASVRRSARSLREAA